MQKGKSAKANTAFTLSHHTKKTTQKWKERVFALTISYFTIFLSHLLGSASLLLGSAHIAMTNKKRRLPKHDKVLQISENGCTSSQIVRYDPGKVMLSAEILHISFKHPWMHLKTFFMRRKWLFESDARLYMKTDILTADP